MSFLGDLRISLSGVESHSPYVAKCEKIIKDFGYKYQPTSMSTIYECEETNTPGEEWDKFMEAARACYMEMRKYSHRIGVEIRVDFKEGRANGIEGKVNSVNYQMNLLEQTAEKEGSA